MSIDYSDMMFPKSVRKKKRKKHKKSILKTRKGICYLCSRMHGDYREQYTEEDHIIYGYGRRELSESEGLKVYLCPDHHRNGQQAVHNSREIRELLCEIAQTEYEVDHTHEEWMRIAGKNYL